MENSQILRPRNPVRDARRKAELSDEKETEVHRCIYCGDTDAFLVRRRRIEYHHIVGRKRDSITVPVCLNCHAVAGECLRDADVPMTSESEPTKFALMIFRAFAVHFSLLSQACWRFAKRMDKK